MELKEELKKLGKMVLCAIGMLFAFASIGGSIGYGITNGEPFSIVAGIVSLIFLAGGFFYFYNKERKAKIEIQKLQDEIEALKRK